MYLNDRHINKTDTAQSGFTLIELLVVISIIGFLSAVVLTALNDARSAAKDAVIKQQIKALAATAELNFNATHSYAEVRKTGFSTDGDLGYPDCAHTNFDDSDRFGPYHEKLKQLCQAIEDNFEGEGYFLYWGTYDINNLNDPTNLVPGAPNRPLESNYSFIVLLNSGEDQAFCVGSSGKTFQGNANDVWNDGVTAPAPPGCYFNP